MTTLKGYLLALVGVSVMGMFFGANAAPVHHDDGPRIQRAHYLHQAELFNQKAKIAKGHAKAYDLKEAKKYQALGQ